MAFKGALLCFQFRTIDDIQHDPGLEYDFTGEAPIAGEALQPIVAEAVARIKRSIAASVSSWFNFGRTITTNLSNFLHISTLTFNTQIEHNDGSTGQTSYVNVIKFYHMGDEDGYRVTLDIEAMYSSAIEAYEEGAYDAGLTGKQIGRLADLLKQEFEIQGELEVLPLVERGRLFNASNKCSEEDETPVEPADSRSRQLQQSAEPDRQSP